MRRCALLLAVGCHLAGPAFAVADAKGQARAVAALKALNAQVTVDDKSPDKPVVQVLLKGQTVTDEAVDHLAALPKLRHVEFHDTTVSGEGLKKLKDLKDLQTLILRDSVVAD